MEDLELVPNELSKLKDRIERLEVIVQILFELNGTGTLDYRLMKVLELLPDNDTPKEIIEQAQKHWNIK